MHILEPFLSVVVFFLSGFLAASSWLAAQIESVIPPTPVVEQVEVVETAEPEGSETITKLPSKYERGGSIPRILLENAAYQKASVFGSLSTTSIKGIATSSTPLPERIERALVNLYCLVEFEDRLRATTGSGVFIDDRGVILTNAHVAQFLLLEEENSTHDVRCVVRSGNPAMPQYEAELLYISPAWILENARLVDAENPSGTGERDYALLYVSKALDGEMPSVFPALTVNDDLVSREFKTSTKYAGGYPAEILLTEGPRAELAPEVHNVSILDIYTFGSGYGDLVTIADSAVGEQGSSGGPVVNEYGEVVGLIATKGTVEDGLKSLRALTLSYVSRTIFEETGFDLTETLTGDLAYRSQVFKDALGPFLSARLDSELE